MGRSFGSAGAGAVSLMFAIIIAKAGAHPNIWYGWILTDPRVVPALLLFSLVCFAISLGQLHSVRVFYFGRLSPDCFPHLNQETKISQQTSLLMADRRMSALKMRPCRA